MVKWHFRGQETSISWPYISIVATLQVAYVLGTRYSLQWLSKQQWVGALVPGMDWVQMNPHAPPSSPSPPPPHAP